MILESTFEKQKSTGKRVRVVTVPVRKLAELAGTYGSAELNTFGSLQMRDGKLILQMPKWDATLQFLKGGECIARPKDSFFSMLAINFLRNDAGQVVGYDLSTERVRNLRYAKVKIE